MTAAVEVCGLTKRFADLVAVDEVDFTAAPGEILGILGPNGAGKTTILHMLLGLITPTRGTVRILGLDLASRRREVLARVNFSSAYTALPTNLSVWENLNFFARLYGLRRPRRKIETLLAAFEIEDTIGRLTGSLSSGQMTRLNLCKAFLNDPEVLLLDEPTASLDPDISEKVRNRLQLLQREQGVTMLYTSHNMQEVQLLCDRVIFLARGRIVMTGPPAEILQKTGSASLEELFIAIARNGELYATDPDKEKLPCGSG
ncbi:MAG: ABC transporter ATP-binding protein [Deltaproteobacteria bacterium CG_4_10_14_3_um_filter_60_8]|nr:MAG: ABC transporter ATP-binding protein [Desulfobacterales bacterium CG2_30_60_27]PIP43885.1 MAG: ABC transporter ATP-binding protein [Deltaproteobacteria bacterium CG23_combo_of_CG06-09_8_20_14_all_60_8]PIY22788.1 MAG: ABC transporter ATP-binding protein [Deltaproteobacteria bacterium CG_4_10_14_3_um_filter_60_8]